MGGVRVTSPVTLVPTGYTNGQPTTWVLTFVAPPHAAGTVPVTLISYVKPTGPPLTFTYLAPSQSNPTQPASEPQLPNTGAQRTGRPRGDGPPARRARNGGRYPPAEPGLRSHRGLPGPVVMNARQRSDECALGVEADLGTC